MASTDPITGGTIVDQSDAATGGFQIGRVMTDLRDKVIPRFTTATARDNAYTAAGVTLVDGMTCWVVSLNCYCIRQGGAWTLWDTVWQTYNPAISAAPSQPFTEIVYNDGARTGRFLRRGRMVDLQVSWKVNSANYTGSGSSVLRFDYPPNLRPADINYPGNFGRPAGTGYAGTSAGDLMLFVLHEYVVDPTLRRMFLVDGTQRSVQGGAGAINIDSAPRFCSFTTSYVIA